MKVFINNFLITIIILLLTLFWIGCSSEQESKKEEGIQNGDSNSITEKMLPENFSEMLKKGDIDPSDIDMSSLTEEQREEVKQAIAKQKEEDKNFAKELATLVGPDPKKANKNSGSFAAPKDVAPRAKAFVDKYFPNLSKSLDTFYKSSGFKSFFSNEEDANITEDQKNELMLDLLKIMKHAPHMGKMKYAFKTIGKTSQTSCGQNKQFRNPTSPEVTYKLNDFTGAFFRNYIFDVAQVQSNEVSKKKGIVFKGSKSSDDDMKGASEYIFNLFYEADENSKGGYKVKPNDKSGILNDRAICQ